MLRRVILAMLIACLAFPAAAMPMLHTQMGHGPQPMMATAGNGISTHHHGSPASRHDDGMAAQTHECIGCMARYDGVALPETPLMPTQRARCVVAEAQIPGTDPGPEAPPPRC